MRRADGRRLLAASVVRQAEAEAQVRRVQGAGCRGGSYRKADPPPVAELFNFDA